MSSGFTLSWTIHADWSYWSFVLVGCDAFSAFQCSSGQIESRDDRPPGSRGPRASRTWRSKAKAKKKRSSACCDEWMYKRTHPWRSVYDGAAKAHGSSALKDMCSLWSDKWLIS